MENKTQTLGRYEVVDIETGKAIGTTYLTKDQFQERMEVPAYVVYRFFPEPLS
jgi:hypothetical protein